MKKLILITIFVICIINIYSQNLVYEELIQKYENNVWENFWKFCYEYDEHDNIILTEFYGWDNWYNEWSLYGITNYTNIYDDEGNLIQRSWGPSSDNYIENFDSEGKLLQDIYFHSWSDPDHWGWSERTNDYNYNEFDQLVLQTQYSEGSDDMSGDWSDSLYVDYFYNDNLLAEKMQYEVQDTVWIAVKNELFGYDNLSNIISRLITIFYNNEWMNYNNYTYEYDLNNNISEYLNEAWDFQGAWYIDGHYIASYTYNGNNNIATITKEVLAEDGTTPSLGLYLYTYDYTVNIEENVINDLHTNYFLSNYPNPFNPTTTIEFSINNNSKVELTIFNVKGQKIKTLTQKEFAKGFHSIIWNGDNESNNPVSSGIYLYKLSVNGKTEAVKKCLLLK